MAYDFSELKQKCADTKEWLQREYTGIRTGRATPAILDSVRVDMYGSKLPINQAASVSVEDARTIRVVPWDASQIKNIEQAIASADLGLSVSDDEKGIRVSFPELTAERRDQLIKLAKSKLEDARVALRTARDETWNDIQKQAKESVITEDEKFAYKEDMQKIIDATNAELDALADAKEKEIRS